MTDLKNSEKCSFTTDCCFGCLSEISIINCNEKLMEIYTKLMDEQIQHSIREITNGFCDGCEKTLYHFKEFIEICKQSRLILENRFIELKLVKETVKCEEKYSNDTENRSNKPFSELKDVEIKDKEGKMYIKTTDPPKRIVKKIVFDVDGTKNDVKIISSEEPEKSQKRLRQAKTRKNACKKEPSLSSGKRGVKLILGNATNRNDAPKLEETTNICTVCLVEITDWNAHIRDKHTDKILSSITNTSTFSCKECQYVTPAWSHMLVHFGQHILLTKPVQCKLCLKSDFNHFQHYRNHWYNSHVNRFYKCDECEFTNSSKAKLETHIFSKHRPHVPYCGHCHKIFMDAEELADHRKQIAKRVSKVHVCDICGEHVTKPLKEHMKYKHSTVDISVPCNICGKVFKHIQRLRQHRYESHSERNFICPHKDCGKKFERNSRLNRHIQSMHMEKEYVDCLVCGRKLVRNGLVLHMRNSHPEIESFHPKNPAKEKIKRTKKCDK